MQKELSHLGTKIESWWKQLKGSDFAFYLYKQFHMRVPTQVTYISVRAHNCIGLLYKLWARPLIGWIKAHSRGHGAAACAAEGAAGSVCVRAALPSTWWASFSSRTPLLCAPPHDQVASRHPISFPFPHFPLRSPQNCCLAYSPRFFPKRYLRYPPASGTQHPTPRCPPVCH